MRASETNLFCFSFVSVLFQFYFTCASRFTHRVLTTSKHSCLKQFDLCSTPRRNRSSSIVTLSHPPSISSLIITDRSFRYASPRLWNQLPDSFRQPRQSCLDSPPHSLVSSSLSSSPVSLSITLSLFHSMLKTYFSTNPSHLNTSSTPRLTSRSWNWTELKVLLDLLLVHFRLIFIARQHTDARYWYSKSVCPSVRLSVTFRYQMKTA